jgi:protein gp37
MRNSKASATAQAAPPKKSWRDVLPIHPAADLFPLLSPDELTALGEDIRKNGLVNPIVTVCYKKADGPREYFLVDGRNRLDAMEMVGGVNVLPTGLTYRTIDGSDAYVCHQEVEGDPYTYVISANIHRRHLTAEQKRDVIAKLLKAQPEKSNRQIADTVKASPTTVGTVRAEMEAKGDVSNLDTRLDSKGRKQPAHKPKPPGGNDCDPQESADRRKAEAAAEPQPARPTLSLPTHIGELVAYPQPQGKAKFNETNEQISWAAWSWNPVTGCLHNCPYCYARELAEKYRDTYPIGFQPLFHHDRLDAPKNTAIPKDVQIDPRLKRVFVCSMADLYGKWVPDDWIEKVHASCIENPQWDYLLLTKFPRRYVGLKLPPTAWAGTSVDEQKRVRLAEEAFRQIKDVRVKWLSLEPLLAPLEFTDLSMFDWVVIGSQSATEQPDGHVKEFAPPIQWVSRLIDQAHEAGCRVYCKPNLLGIVNPQSPGMTLPQEAPAAEPTPREAAK